MRPIHAWLAEYGESHRHPVNKAVHWVCVPLIMLSLVAMFAALPRPGAFGVSPLLTWGTVLIALAIAYYLVLAPRLAAGMLLVGALLVVATYGLSLLPWPLAASGAVIFVASWIGQFAGHRVEGRKPSFFKDVQFLLIGPLWLLAWLYRRFDLRIA